MNLTLKSVLIHFGIAILLIVMLVIMPQLLTVFLSTEGGWNPVFIVYVFIGMELILFYFLTSYTNVSLSVSSFIWNFIFSIIELVCLDSYFQEVLSRIYDYLKYSVFALPGFLWAMNKLIIDRVFILMKFSLSPTNRIERLLKRNQ